MRSGFPILFTALILLAACREEAPVDDPGVIAPPEGADEAAAVTPPDTCGAEAWSRFIGQHVDTLAAVTLPAPVRVIGPNDAVTMDFLPTRLNVRHDENGVIERVDCG